MKIAREKSIGKKLNEVQAKCKERLMTMADIQNGLDMLEKAFRKLGTKPEGLEVTFSIHFQKFPNAYKYHPMGTVIAAKVVNSRWEVEVARRDVNRPHEYYWELGELSGICDRYDLR